MLYEAYQKYFIAFFVLIGCLIFYLIKRKKEDGGSLADFFHSKGNSLTPFLDLYTVDFTRLAREGKVDPVVGREEEVRKLSQVLARRGKNNAILIGEPGVGKTAIVEGLAQRIVKEEVPDTLLNKRLMALDVSTMLAGTKYRGEFEQRAKKIVMEITNSHRSIILFIDEVHSVVQSHGSEGAVNFADILKPALARGDLQMIGATTFAEYEKYIKTDLSLERRFQPVEIREPNQEETVTILKGIKDKYREYHKVEFTDAALEASVRLSEQLIKDRKLPDKAIDAIDEAGAMVKVSHIHKSVPAILYQAAISAHPEVANIWKEIQQLDANILIEQDDAKKINYQKNREDLESKLIGMGIVTVDSNDIEKVIKEWIKNN